MKPLRARPPDTTTVSSKGQVVLPSWARRELGIAAGDRLRVEVVKGAGERAVILKLPGAVDIDEMLERGYKWLEESGEDPVAAFQEARRQARLHERNRWRPRRRRRADID